MERYEIWDPITRGLHYHYAAPHGAWVCRDAGGLCLNFGPGSVGSISRFLVFPIFGIPCILSNWIETRQAMSLHNSPQHQTPVKHQTFKLLISFSRLPVFSSHRSIVLSCCRAVMPSFLRAVVLSYKSPRDASLAALSLPTALFSFFLLLS